MPTILLQLIRFEKLEMLKKKKKKKEKKQRVIVKSFSFLSFLIDHV